MGRNSPQAPPSVRHPGELLAIHLVQVARQVAVGCLPEFSGRGILQLTEGLEHPGDAVHPQLPHVPSEGQGGSPGQAHGAPLESSKVPEQKGGSLRAPLVLKQLHAPPHQALQHPLGGLRADHAVPFGHQAQVGGVHVRGELHDLRLQLLQHRPGVPQPRPGESPEDVADVLGVEGASQVADQAGQGLQQRPGRALPHPGEAVQQVGQV
mmetsp:Transcript_6940/g.19637  ORF Transcript_6940/g.19637 Transcript_6940/m.19637 type:complete len:209 (+) Transcript_6940:582-1208(+)